MDRIQFLLGYEPASYGRLIGYDKGKQAGVVQFADRLGSAGKQTHLIRAGQISVVDTGVFDEHSVPIEKHSYVAGSTNRHG
jgi:hypothetical protein